jgi:hypothetical protein
MLVGAGGNAGAQAAVTVIQGEVSGVSESFVSSATRDCVRQDHGAEQGERVIVLSLSVER